MVASFFYKTGMVVRYAKPRFEMGTRSAMVRAGECGGTT
ncbi:hypothetical protein MIDIC_140017 [Alphaproteobacteria bacterium]